MANYRFVRNNRLGISLPVLDYDWDDYTELEQTRIVEHWETIRGTIPDRIIVFEQQIRIRQSQLYEEDDFEVSCLLNYEIAEFASRINDLHIWYRINQEIESRRHS
jgi:hypothetical protein